MLADKFTKHRPLTSGVVFNLINLATITFLSLISLPFYLKILGAETFGIYTMIVVVPTALSIFSPGITTSVTYHVAKAINNDRRKQLDLIILTGLICHFILGVIASGVHLFIPETISEVLGVPESSSADFWRAIRMISLLTFVLFTLNIFVATFKGAKMFGVATIISVSQQKLFVCVTFVLDLANR